MRAKKLALGTRLLKILLLMLCTAQRRRLCQAGGIPLAHWLSCLREKASVPSCIPTV